MINYLIYECKERLNDFLTVANHNLFYCTSNNYINKDG